MHYWYIVQCTILIFLKIIVIEASNLPQLSVGIREATYYCTLYNDSNHSAITWFNPRGEIADYHTTSSWIRIDGPSTEMSGGAVLKRKFTNFPPVLNELWQDFSTTFLTFHNPLVINGEDFRLSFSFKAEEVHLFLCDDESLTSANCYSITLGGNGGAKNFVRKCNSGEIPTDLTKDPIGDCLKSQTEFENSSVINSEEWHHISVEKKGNAYRVWKYGWKQSILSYNDDTQSPFEPTYFLLWCPDLLGVGKIHELDVFEYRATVAADFKLRNPSRCLSFFLKPCENCTAEIVASDVDGNVIGTARSDQSIEFQQVVLRTSRNDGRTNIKIKLIHENGNATGDGKWYLGNRILRCREKGDVVELVSSMKGCCYALKYPEHKICWNELNKYNPRDWKCPSGTFGKNCIPCNYTDHKCSKGFKVCDITSSGLRCSCPHGFRNKYCNQNCLGGSYGFDCREKCDKCKNSCDPVTGICITDDCVKNPKAEPFSDIHHIPKLNATVDVIKTTCTSVTVSIDVKHNEQMLPASFKIEISAEDKDQPNYYDINLNINNTHQRHFFDNLNPNTEYEVAITFLSPVDFKMQPTNFRTTCEAPGEVQMLTVYSTNKTSISLRWLPPYNLTGNVNAYRIYREYKTENTTTTLQTILSPSQIISCKLWDAYICYTRNDLVFNTTYIFRVSAKYENGSNFGKYVETQATTVPRPPSSPVKFDGHWDENYNLILTWMHPRVPNGVIAAFFIMHSKTRTWTYKYIEEEEPVYNFTINTSKWTAQTLSVRIGALTEEFTSENAAKIIRRSPPKRPTFLRKPKLEDVTQSSFEIVLSDVADVERTTATMFAIITHIHQDAPNGHANHQDFFKRFPIENGSSWFLDAYNLHRPFPKVISYNNSEKRIEFFHDDVRLPSGILQLGRSYQVLIILNNSFAGYSRYTIYPLKFEVNYGWNQYLLILLSIPVTLCGVGIILFKRYYDRKRSNFLIPRHTESREIGQDGIYDIPGGQHFEMADVELHETLRKRMRETSRAAHNERVLANSPEHESNMAFLRNNSIKILNQIRRSSKGKYTKVIHVRDLENYLREAIHSGELERQFKDISSCQMKAWNSGMMPENKNKNMVPNIPAYDHSRVQLEIANRDPFSDYINANFINGYNSQNTYIATQGPKENTIYDFWRMIWQEKVENIIVVSGVIENRERKFDNYWPEINDLVNFGDFNVVYTKVEVFANYEIRRLEVSRNNETRIVKQLHFSCSPHAGIPPYIRSFASFSKKMFDLPLENSPVVVHGSEGFGRTGILILVDICLRMALDEGKVDIFHHLYKLREQRAYMVENVEQYKTVHFILLQILQYISAPSKTGIVCSRTMKYEVDDVIAKKLDIQLKFLDDSAWQDEAMRAIDWNGNHPDINPKKAFPSNSTDDFSQAAFYPYPSENPSQTYIRAEVVDSFSDPSRFIVTRNPTIHTLGIFWQLVVEKQIKTIVSLNKLNPMDAAACVFYPTSKALTFNPLPSLKVKFTSKNTIGHCDIYNVTATNTYQKKTPITVIQLNDWHQTSLHPNKATSLITTFEIMNTIGKSSSTILVTCHDGIRASGLYVALCYILEKIKLNHVCDVCLAVQTVRQSRREFVRPPEQFQFLYECGYEYVRQFETYANFTREDIRRN